MEVSGYPARSPVNRFELAVRHMLLEEVKHRLMEPTSAAARDRALLLGIANALRIQYRRTDRVFAICLGDVPVLDLPGRELFLYVRGDSLQASQRQIQMSLRLAGEPDAALAHNRQEVADTVDRLIEYVRRDPGMLERIERAADE